MRKFVLFGATLIAFMASMAFAGGYKTLTFTSGQGETYEVVTANLELFVVGDNLTFSNTDLIIPLSSLVSMEFTDYSNEWASIDTMVPGLEGGVAAYSLNGVYLKTFNSLTEALSSLGKGIFVIKDGEGRTLKVNIDR